MVEAAEAAVVVVSVVEARPGHPLEAAGDLGRDRTSPVKGEGVTEQLQTRQIGHHKLY